MTEGPLVDRPDMIEGARLFHASRFWDAHEAWERVWIVEKDVDRRRFVQGLIQLAAALHKLLVMKNPVSALALARRAREKLAPFPTPYEGYAADALRAQMDACEASIAEVVASEMDLSRFNHATIPRIGE